MPPGSVLLGLVFFTIIKSIIVGLLIALGLWILCSFLCVRLFSGFRLNIKHHLFGFLMAVLTLILYISLSVTSAAKSKIDDAKNYIGSISSFADQLDIKQLSDYLTEEVPELKTFLENENLSEEMKNKLDEMLSMNLNTKEKKDMIQSYISDSFAGSIDKPVKKTWWTLLLLLIFVQAAYWTTMFYLANRKSKRVNSASTYRSDDYIL